MVAIKQRVFNVAIITPYLTEGLERFALCGKDMREQASKYGYSPENLAGKKFIWTQNKAMTKIITPGYENGDKREQLYEDRLREADFVIAGCTSDGEMEVRGLKGSGLIIARYSTFYGRESDYTGNRPEQSGYSLDIPKDTNIVRILLAHDPFLEGLVERDQRKIEGSIAELNEDLNQSILVTPYLVEALKR
ncbi:MAG: hypothetical protein Q7S74_01205 [Nanoarchaeota archaeon]|nr:hypothetical protein [Nanoarchaeota archaeon]